MLDVIVCILIFIVGINLKNWFRGFDAYDKNILTWLFLWHILVGIGYILYTAISGGGDAWGYWDIPKYEGWDIVLQSIHNGSASGYIFLINYFPSKVLNLSFFTGSMMYVLLGYTGLVYLYKIIKETLPNYRVLQNVRVLGIPVFPYFLFLPNTNFWTSGLGKDTIIFFSIIIFIYALKNIKKRYGYIIIATLLSAFIRPHILLFLFTSFGLATTFDVKIKAYTKVFLYIVFISLFLVLLPRVMAFVNIESLDTDTIETYADKQAGALAHKAGTGSSIDISNYPYPLKVFTFLFRPLFVDMPTVFGIIASVENLIFLIFFLKVIRRRPISGFWRGNITTKALLFFFIIGSLIFPLILGNLGIILRQKNPFVVAFIIFGYWSLINYYTTNITKSKEHLENIALY